MRTALREFWPYLVVAAALHGALVVFLVTSLDRSVPVAPAAAPDPIEASVVDEALVEQELARLEEAERRRLHEIDEGQRAAEAAAQQRQQEERRLRDLAQQREREQREAAERREAERRAAEAAAQQRADEERRLREAREAREQAEREEQARREREAREAAAQRQREEEERRQAAERDRLLGQYVTAITDKVQRNWYRPDAWPAGTRCTVRVSQIPGGEVVEVRITQSCGDSRLDRTVEDAVLRASPLPAPPDPAVFRREIEFVFRPEN